VGESVTDIEQVESGAIATLGDGRSLHADHVILATGNFSPAVLPGVSQTVQSAGAYKNNAWLAETYSELGKDDPVTLVGTGLTAVDVVLRLREVGHRGQVTAISRHGFFPHRHSEYQPLNDCAIPAGTAPTCVDHLRALRRSIGNVAEWRAVIDSLRDTTNDLWLAMPLKEQKRFRRHLQRRWDVVRHRMAPPVANSIEAELAAGTLVIREGHLDSVVATDGGAKVTILTHQGIESYITTRVINCTGPSMNYRRVRSSLFDNLFARGLATSGQIGGGFLCTRSGAMIGADGTASQVLFNLGPGRLGTLIESIAIPEIRDQALELAKHIAAQSERRERQSREGISSASIGCGTESQPVVVAA